MKNPENQKLIDAAFALAETGEWQDANLAKIAKTAKMPLSAVFSIARSKTQILKLIDTKLTAQVLEEVGDISEGTSTRDALFDLLMTRFEIMNQNRAAFLHLNESISKSLGQSLKCLGASKDHMALVAEMSGIDTSGISGSAKTLSLTYLYLNSFNTWLNDESDDLSATMKKLDTDLSKAESWALELQSLDLNSVFNWAKKRSNKAENEAET